MLKRGDIAPEFSLPDQDDRLRTLTLLLRDGPLVLFFYPSDFTPLCTREACAFRDRYDDLRAAGLSLAGISPQNAESHRSFRAQHSLHFPLLSDPERRVIRDYGADWPGHVGVRRVTYLVDTHGRIRASRRADLRVSRHTDFLDEALALAGAAQPVASP